jgi:hypothetical protein
MISLILLLISKVFRKSKRVVETDEKKNTSIVRGKNVEDFILIRLKEEQRSFEPNTYFHLILISVFYYIITFYKLFQKTFFLKRLIKNLFYFFL